MNETVYLLKIGSSEFLVSEEDGLAALRLIGRLEPVDQRYLNDYTKTVYVVEGERELSLRRVPIGERMTREEFNAAKAPTEKPPATRPAAS